MQIAIDRTAIIFGPRGLARQYAAAAEQDAEGPVTHGGTLTITAFGWVGVRPLTVLHATFPSLGQEGAAVRGADEANWRAAIAAAVNVAVGLAKASPAYAQALDSLTSSPGSDIARELAYQLEQQPHDPGVPTIINILSDGLTDISGLDLVKMIQHGASPQAAAMLVRQARTPTSEPRPALVTIAPVGITSGRGQLGPDATAHLIATWTLALRKLPIGLFTVSATL